MARVVLRVPLLFLTAAFLCLGSTAARAVPLSDLLLGGAFIDSDGLRFSNFQYSGTGDMPNAMDVNVTSIMDQYGNYGIRFQALFLDLPGDSTGSDAGLSFKVEVIEGALISDAHLFGNPDLIPDPGAEGFVTVDEQIGGQQMQIFKFAGPLFDDLPELLRVEDWVVFEPTAELSIVLKDISAFAFDGIATISIIDQTFSREFPPVPEPGTMLLLGFGLAGLAVTGRRRS